MTKQHIEHLIQTALTALRASGKLSAEAPVFLIEVAKDKKHGDFASNVALALAKSEQRKPQELAQMIVQALPASAQVQKVTIAGPGFINFFLSPESLFTIINDIIHAGEKYGHADIANGKSILLEFVSANPNGPLHVGHGRHAAYGAVVADLLEAVGYRVHREYYVNDAGRQMDIVTTSTWLRYLALCGETIVFPDNGYKGEYVNAIAGQLYAARGAEFSVAGEKVFQGLPSDECNGGDKEVYIDAIIERTQELLGAKSYTQIFDVVLHTILTDIQDDLAEFGVTYQTWFSEKEFIQSGAVLRTIGKLKDLGITYVSEGALWFRSTDFGDEKDRVLQRSNGKHTYFANDLAYHINKFERNFDHAIDIFGADHHGYIPRMRAGLAAVRIMPDQLTYLLVQFVTLYRNGQQAQMSTRSGSFVTLRELREEVGNDAARFFYVMRKCEQHVDFDLDLAKSQSNENPVYYIQYAHARICSVFRQAKNHPLSPEDLTDATGFALLTQPHELTLLGTLGRYTDVIKSAANQYGPHILTNYLRELATDFHAYYNSTQFLVEDADLRSARLSLIQATQQVLVNGLKLLGVSAPENM